MTFGSPEDFTTEARRLGGEIQEIFAEWEFCKDFLNSAVGARGGERA